MPKVDYLLINNSNNLRLLLLIEVSNCASTRFKDLYFIKDIIINSWVKICNFLKILNFLLLVNNTERIMVLKELIGIVKKKDDVNFNKNYYHY